jgi:hypothetical protein
MPRYHFQFERQTLSYGEVVIEAESEAEAQEEVEEIKARPDVSSVMWEIQTDEIITTSVEELEG